MARIFVTGSADGLGRLAARRMVAVGHRGGLHGRNRDPAQQGMGAVPGAPTALEGGRCSGSRADANNQFFGGVVAFPVPRLWPHVLSNAVDPGWVPTKMGGPSASDDLEQGTATQVWLAVSDERGAKVSGQCFYHMRTQAAHQAASDVTVQNDFLATCEQLTRVRLGTAVAK